LEINIRLKKLADALHNGIAAAKCDEERINSSTFDEFIDKEKMFSWKIHLNSKMTNNRFMSLKKNTCILASKQIRNYIHLRKKICLTNEISIFIAPCKNIIPELFKCGNQSVWH
jgi:hypothetical protein